MVDEVVKLLDSKQLVMLFGLDDTDCLLQDQVKCGADLDDRAVSYKLSIVTKAEAAHLSKIFHGASPNVAVCTFPSEMENLNEVLKFVMSNVQKLNKLSVIMFEDVQNKIQKCAKKKAVFESSASRQGQH